MTLRLFLAASLVPALSLAQDLLTPERAVAMAQARGPLAGVATGLRDVAAGLSLIHI